jgi:hypothetical protein
VFLVIWVSLPYVSFIEEQNRAREKREGLLIFKVKREENSNTPTFQRTVSTVPKDKLNTQEILNLTTYRRYDQ